MKASLLTVCSLVAFLITIGAGIWYLLLERRSRKTVEPPKPADKAQEVTPPDPESLRTIDEEETDGLSVETIEAPEATDKDQEATPLGTGGLSTIGGVAEIGERLSTAAGTTELDPENAAATSWGAARSTTSMT